MISKMKNCYICIIVAITIIIVTYVSSIISNEKFRIVNSIYLFGKPSVHVFGHAHDIGKEVEQPSKTKYIEQDNSNENTIRLGNINVKYSQKIKDKEKHYSVSGNCPPRGSKLVGPLFIDQIVPKEEDTKGLSVEFGGTVEKGGWWEPSTCISNTRVAIIIPYRKRENQLRIFLHHMHPFLQRQQLYYRIIVVEQLKDSPFNRAGLFNIGFAESLKMGDFDCFIFSDVDLLPEDDRNYYGCPTSPRHMSVAVDKFNYKLPYATIFGGVGAFKKEHFEKINGMSNLFWGWGGEDDDLYQRITQVGFKLTRPSMKIGRYTMIKLQHFVSSKADPNRMNLLRNSKERMVVDGLNTLKYTLMKVVEKPLVTFIQIELNKNDYFQ